MLRNYFLTAFRSTLKNKAFSLINIFGLIFSMAICLFAITVLLNIVKTDKFHSKKDRAYRLITSYSGQYDTNSEFATSPIPLKNKIIASYPEVEAGTSLRRFSGTAKKGEKAIDFNGLYTDTAFFNIFDFELLQGDYKELNNPYSIFITEKLAKKIFNDKDAIGESVHINNLGLFQVKGIIKPAKGPSHLRFELLGSINTFTSLEKDGKEDYPMMENWNNFWMSSSYFLFKPNANLENFKTSINEFSKEKYADKKFSAKFDLQNIASISPGKNYNNEIGFVFPYAIIIGFGAIALVILSITGFNYLNLSLAKSVSKSKEIGLRKVIGSTRKHIAWQYIAESTIILVASFILSTILFEYAFRFATRQFPELQGEMELERSYVTYLVFFLFSIFIGVVFGLLSSFKLSRTNPIHVLKDSGNDKIITRFALRKVLISIQFVISATFIITTILIFKQLQTVIKTDFGFNKENLISVRLQQVNYNVVENEFKYIKGIDKITATRYLPITGSRYRTSINSTKIIDTLMTDVLNVGTNYVEFMELELLAGRSFDESRGMNNKNLLIINEMAARKFGYENAASAIGEFLTTGEEQYEVIGVVKDFMVNDPFSAPDNLILTYWPDQFESLVVKYAKDADYDQVIADMKEKWEKIDATIPFEHQSYEDNLNRIYDPVTTAGTIAGGISLLAISISCLGLLGMMAYSAQSNKKEMGIRKVMGAYPMDIIKQLSKSYIKIISIATVISLTIVAGITSLVKMQIPNTIGFDIPSVLLGLLIIFSITALTIISQTWKASRTSPVESLRYE